jgi:hypothetical protein
LLSLSVSARAPVVKLLPWFSVVVTNAADDAWKTTKLAVSTAAVTTPTAIGATERRRRCRSTGRPAYSIATSRCATTPGLSAAGTEP